MTWILIMTNGLLEDLIDVQSLLKKRRDHVPRQWTYYKRGRVVHHEIIMRNHFCENHVYDDVLFCTRFRMSRRLFLKMVDTICAFDLYFLQNFDATETLGLWSIQKCIAAIRMIGYGVPSDATDEYTRAAKNIAMESMKRFVRAIRGIYEKQYLRHPMREDLENH